jgi:cytochrome c553
VKIARAIQIVLATCVLVATSANAQDPAVKDPSNELAALLELKGDLDRGKTVFAACHDCHRKDASGRANGVFPRLAGQYASVLIKQLSDIRAGRRNNPSMQPLAATLSRGDIADVAAYLQSLPINQTHGKGPGGGVTRGRQLYDRDCASCHGGNGEGVGAKFYPMVAAQHYRYLLREVVSIRDGERGNSDPAMVQAVKNYSQVDIEAVADYMSQLPPPKR